MSVDVNVRAPAGDQLVIEYMSDCVAIFRNNLLSERFEDWDESDVNLIFIHYIMGLVVCIFGDAPPRKQMNFIQRLAELEISREEAVRALHAVPPGGRGGLARAVEAAEQAGRHDGRGVHRPSVYAGRTAQLGAF
ncbi:hypothetical protein [Roseixanthobacter liquoris]|uniref:hypothetical protein n=1 Tax=Roseixanthobacter liquoris TaxID=3119921 RepID=UPI003729F25E